MENSPIINNQSTLDSPLAKSLIEVFDKGIIKIAAPHQDLTIIINKEDVHSYCQTLKDDANFAFEQMMDLTAVDYLLLNKDYRFEVVYHLFSLTHGHRLRIKCMLNEDELNVPTISDLWVAANWYERECFDMYGINFIGHPNLKRILLYPEFEGHPLRKDYPITKEQPLLPLKDVTERHQYMIDRNL